MTLRKFSRLTTLFLKLALIFISTLFTYLSLEVGLRYAGPDWLFFRMEELKHGETTGIGTDTHSTLEWNAEKPYRYTPNSQFPIVHYEYHHEAHIDEYGGRRTYTPLSEGIPLLPTMGDSFTFGIGVEDDETYTHRIAQKLTDFRLLNLGIPGTALHQQLDILELRHEELDAPHAYVFFFYIGNDLTALIDAHHGTKGANPSQQAHGQQNPLIHAVNRYFFHRGPLRHSYAAQFIKQQCMSLLNQQSSLYMDSFFRVTHKDESITQKSLESLNCELQRLRQLADTRNFRYIFILIPSRFQIRDDLYQHYLDYYHLDPEKHDPRIPTQSVVDALKQNHIPYIDLLDPLKQSPDADTFYYIRDDHFTPAGHRATADYLELPLRNWLSQH